MEKHAQYQLQNLIYFLEKQGSQIGKVVDFDGAVDTVQPLDFTSANLELTPTILSDTDRFSVWVTEKLAAEKARYGIGGYNEHRTIYSRSEHFNADEEPRRLHLGIDIWGPAGTPIYNFHNATVHSFKFNDQFGDYGATIILSYQLGNCIINGLYGHLDLASLNGLEQGQFVPKGKQFATFGVKEENGFWPPHLHFQLIFDMENQQGDYPGVCQFSKREEYLANCPDPMLILHQTFTSSMP